MDFSTFPRFWSMEFFFFNWSWNFSIFGQWELFKLLSAAIHTWCCEKISGSSHAFPVLKLSVRSLCFFSWKMLSLITIQQSGLRGSILSPGYFLLNITTVLIKQGSTHFFLNGQIVNILGFEGEEGIWKTWCRNLRNHCKFNYLKM